MHPGPPYWPQPNFLSDSGHIEITFQIVSLNKPWKHPVGKALRLVVGAALAAHVVFFYPPLLDTHSARDYFFQRPEVSWMQVLACILAALLLCGVLWDMARGPSTQFLMFRFGEPPVTADPKLLDALNPQHALWGSSFFGYQAYLREAEAFRLNHQAELIDSMFGEG